MTEPRWRLEMSLLGPFGEKITVAVMLDPSTASEVARIAPPTIWNLPVGPTKNFLEETVKVLKRREYRKDLFGFEAARLGKLLAEHMEDKEGWHGIERQEVLTERDKR